MTHKWWEQTINKKYWRFYSDFNSFLHLVWKHLNLPAPTPMQRDIATYLESSPKRTIIQAFRGAGKSWITSAFVLWKLMRNPQLKIMVVSASKERSDNFSTFTLRLISELPIIQFLMPSPNQRTSKIAFDVRPAKADQAPSVKSVGIFGQLTGSRADIIIADDVEVSNNSETQGMRDKLSERVKEFEGVLKPNGSIIYLGTPQSEESLYTKLLDRGYETRIWPVRYPDITQKPFYQNHLSPILLQRLEEKPERVGEPTDPDRFDEYMLREREMGYGRSGFALQFMLDTSLADEDRYPLKLKDLIVMDLDAENAPERVIWSNAKENFIGDLESPGLKGDKYYQPALVHGNWIPYTGAVLFIDPAGRGKDETAYAVVKMLNGQLFLTKSGGLAGGYSPEVLDGLTKLAKDQKVNAIQIESNFGDGMFMELLKPYLRNNYPCPIEEVRHHKQKERRIIDTLEPVFNQHRLIIDREVIVQDRKSTRHLPGEDALRKQLGYQITRITNDRGALVHDDRLDALAGAVKYWTDKMGQDAQENQKARDRWLLEMEQKSIMKQGGFSLDGQALGYPPEKIIKQEETDDTWM